MEIRNDEEYYAVLDRIIRGAEFIEKNDVPATVYAKAVERYTHLCRVAQEYRMRGSDEHECTERIKSRELHIATD